ncbi:MAG: cysteine hydrolase [Fibrobacter sp.]|nr:cysteine hydrolase [Fibrobacter sp.]
MNTALLIIDVQKDYFPGGKMELQGSIEAGLKIKELLKEFRAEKKEIIHIKHISMRPGATFFIPDTEGVDFHENVVPFEGETVFVKNYPNSFRDTGLLEYLNRKNIKRLVITGMMTHMCIDTTVRAAFDYGFECIVAGDCCATRGLNFGGRDIEAGHVQDAFLAALDGVFAKVKNSDQILKSV